MRNDSQMDSQSVATAQSFLSPRGERIPKHDLLAWRHCLAGIRTSCVERDLDECGARIRRQPGPHACPNTHLRRCQQKRRAVRWDLAAMSRGVLQPRRVGRGQRLFGTQQRASRFNARCSTQFDHPRTHGKDICADQESVAPVRLPFNPTPDRRGNGKEQ